MFCSKTTLKETPAKQKAWSPLCFLFVFVFGKPLENLDLNKMFEQTSKCWFDGDESHGIGTISKKESPYTNTTTETAWAPSQL